MAGFIVGRLPSACCQLVIGLSLACEDSVIVSVTGVGIINVGVAMGRLDMCI